MVKESWLVGVTLYSRYSNSQLRSLSCNSQIAKNKTSAWTQAVPVPPSYETTNLKVSACLCCQSQSFPVEYYPITIVVQPMRADSPALEGTSWIFSNWRTEWKIMLIMTAKHYCSSELIKCSFLLPEVPLNSICISQCWQQWWCVLVQPITHKSFQQLPQTPGKFEMKGFE